MEPAKEDFTELQKRLLEAQKNGSAKYDGPEGQFYLVAPHTHVADASEPFTGAENLLDPPLARAAYSDRSAWLLANMSQLAYRDFEKDENAQANLLRTLTNAGFSRIEFFDCDVTGTQAFLAIRPGSFAVLAFRGTEKNKRDIFTDLSARFYDTADGKAHQGFAKAFESVEGHLRKSLGELSLNHPDLQIFITGHSLGGALATAATHTLEKDFLISACYTFGSPRVGTAEWSDSVKTPIYRVVNSADGVPMVPGNTVLRTVLLWLPNLPLLTWLERPVEKFVSAGFVGFQHAGDMRFLVGDGNSAKLKIGSAAAWARFRHVVIGKFLGALKALNPKALSATFSDHAISGYVKKLRVIAERRNQK